MKQNHNGKSKGWKWAFLILLAFNLAFVGVIASRILQPRENTSYQTTNKTSKDIKIGSFTTNKEHLNKTIASYLKSYQDKTINYEVHVTSTAILFEGSYRLLGYDVPLYVYFEPNRLENGDIQLTVTSFSVGTLPLPVSEVLKYIASSYNLPDFVKVNPGSSAIDLQLSQIKTKDGVYLKATRVDLVNDEIRLDVFKKTH